VRVVVVTLFIYIFWVSHAQVVNPKMWYIGYQTPFRKDTNALDTDPILKQIGSTILNFKNNPITLSRYAYALSHGACNVQLYDVKDSLILYSNGSKIFNGKHRLIEGGDSLSYGSDWTTSPFAGNYYGEFNIRVFHNAMIGLPSVKSPQQFFFISVFIPVGTAWHEKIVYSVVDMSLNGGRGKVIEKEVVLKTGKFAEAITACKHGNGRDWWIIAREYGKKNFSIFLLDSSGIKLKLENQLSGWDFLSVNLEQGNHTNRFSYDGTMFASFTHLGVELFDFNRCNGFLTNRREITLPLSDTLTYAGGGGFSPNNKLLYVGNIQKYYQVDIFNGLKLRKIATNDGYRDTPMGQTGGIETNFGLVQLAADGKLYMNTTSTTRYLHVIENPNDTGVLCNFKQRAIKLLTFNNGLPKYPNYELGAVVDKCGESGITDNEIEKIEVYPNPVSEFLVVSGQKLAGISIEMYNLLGQKMSPSIEAKNQGYRLGVQTLPEGIYLLQVSDKNHNLIKTERLVITR
jgi:Secretion system C-terminal sorting domain